MKVCKVEAVKCKRTDVFGIPSIASTGPRFRLARGGAPAGAGRMVVERINKTELRTAVCGELEGLGGARRSGCPASQKSDLTMWEVRCDE